MPPDWESAAERTIFPVPPSEFSAAGGIVEGCAGIGRTVDGAKWGCAVDGGLIAGPPPAELKDGFVVPPDDAATSVCNLFSPFKEFEWLVVAAAFASLGATILAAQACDPFASAVSPDGVRESLGAIARVALEFGFALGSGSDGLVCAGNGATGLAVD
jgi:hypothetical protein